MEILKDYNDYLTVNDVYKILPLGKTQIYTLVRNGNIRNRKVGNKYIIPKTAIIDFFEEDSIKNG